MKHPLYSIRLFPFLLLAMILLSSANVLAQQDEDEVIIDSSTTSHPQIRKFKYKSDREAGRPIDFMIREPLAPSMDKHILRTMEINADSLYRNGLRIYFDAARPYIEMMRMEDDIDLMRLTDTTGYTKYKEIPELERKSFELARAYQDASKTSAKETVEKELQNTLSRLFELREERKQDEVKRIEADLQKTKAKMADRKANKQTIVKRRMDQLLGKRDDLEW